MLKLNTVIKGKSLIAVLGIACIGSFSLRSHASLELENVCLTELPSLTQDYQKYELEYLKTREFIPLMQEIHQDAQKAAWAYTGLATLSTSIWGAGLFGSALSAGSVTSGAGLSSLSQTLSAALKWSIDKLLYAPSIALLGNSAGMLTVMVGPVSYTLVQSGIEITTQNEPPILVEYSNRPLSHAILIEMASKLEQSEKEQFEAITNPTTLNRAKDGVTFGHFEKNQFGNLIETSKAKLKVLEALKVKLSNQIAQLSVVCD